MIPTTPYATPAFRRSLIVIPPDPVEEKRQRERQEILDGFAREARADYNRDMRGARYGILFAVFAWIAIWIVWGLN